MRAIKLVLEAYNLNLADIKYHINPIGRFVIGGFYGETRLIGRKIRVDTFGTEKVSEIELAEAVKKVFNLTPRGIERSLELRRGKFKYQDLAVFGHI